jgi:farnesyl-diphosphate farnesyltransferase
MWNNPTDIQIEQWTEHHYPSFLEITTAGDKPSTSINAQSLDARAQLFSKMGSAIQAKVAAERRETFLADLRAKGILKEQTPEQKEASRLRMEEEANAPFPWLLIGGIVFGLLFVMAMMGAGIAYVIWKYAD